MYAIPLYIYPSIYKSTNLSLYLPKEPSANGYDMGDSKV